MADTYYKSSDQILVVNRNIAVCSWDARPCMFLFDFEFRTLTVINEYNRKNESTSVHPFSALDPDMLQEMHDKLADLGGNPKPLGPVADPKRAFAVPQGLRRPTQGPKP